MGKQKNRSYLESLQAWVAKSGRGQTRRATEAVFTAVRDDVMVAVLHGYNLRTIWEHLRDTGRYPGSYEVFRRQTRRAQRALRNKQQPSSLSLQPKPATPTAVTPPPKPAAPPQDGIGGFYMQPMSKEELFG